MLWRLLKNDLRNGLLTNIVMIIFLSVSTMLACSSISLIYSSQNQISYFMDTMGNVTDYNFSMMNVTKKDEEHIKKFMEENQIKEYRLENNVNLPLAVMKFNGKRDLESSGCFATTVPETYNLMFDENNEIPVIHQGEVGIPITMKNQLNLKLGDIFTIERGEHIYSFTISCFTRDSLYGSEMLGQKRILLHPDDYETQYQATSVYDHVVVLSVNKGPLGEHLEFEMQQAGLPDYILISKDTAELSFMGMGMGTSALLLMSGIILLAMSFLIIRFTILAQIENNYTEIGIMKAIGFQHTQIKPLYLMKYMGITFIGTIIGFLCSIPFTDFLEEMQGNIVPPMPGQAGTLLSLLIVFLILGLVYGVTSLVLRRLRKQSTMDAIRKGNSGETYQKHSYYALSKRHHMPIPGYLAIVELFSNIKHTCMLLLIYAFCMLLMLVPLTLKDSFQKDAFLQILKISVADLYSQQNGGISLSSLQQMKEDLQKDLMAYDDQVRVEMETMTSAAISDQGVNTSAFLMKRTPDYDMIFDTGTKPLLDDEIAITTTLAKQYDKHVGDTITLSYENRKKDYIITGTYSSMMNLGNTILAGNQDYDYAYTGYLVINFSGNDTQRAKTADIVKKQYQGMKLIDGADMMKSFSGDMSNQITAMSNLIIGIIVFVLFSLTILFSKLHMIRSTKEIALLQSLGYHKTYIHRWLMQRMMMLGGIAAILGMLIHSLLTARILNCYFQSMGMGNVNLISDSYHAYVIYPILFLCVIFLAQWIVNHTMSHWNVEDLSEE